MRNISGIIFIAMLMFTTAGIFTACGDEESPVVICTDMLEYYCDLYEDCNPGPASRIECLRNAHENLFPGAWDCEDVKRVNQQRYDECMFFIGDMTCDEMGINGPLSCSDAFVIPGLQ